MCLKHTLCNYTPHSYRHMPGLLVYIYIYNLREFVLRTTVILTPGACGREVPSGSPWTGSAGSGGSAGSPDGFIFAHFICVFTAKNARTSLRCNVCLTVSYTSHLKHLVLRAFLEDCLPEMFSKLGV